MQIHKFRLRSVLLGLMVAPLLASCLNTGDLSKVSSCSALGPCTSSSGSGAGGGGSSTSPTASTESPMSITVKTFWENDTGKQFPATHAVKLIDKVSVGPSSSALDDVYVNNGNKDDLTEDICQIEANTEITADPDQRNITCGVQIPETQLYLSSLELQVNVSKDADCDVVFYWPYYYRAGTTATFTSRWQTSAIDCSGTTISNSCYSGPAIDIADFPTFVGLYNQIYDKTKVYTQTYSVPSANTKLRRDNRWTSYRRDRPTGEFIRDWRWQCVQKGSSLNFGITLRIYPEKDSPFNDGAPRRLGWLDDDGVDRGLSQTGQ